MKRGRRRLPDPVARLIAAWNKDGVHVHRAQYNCDFGYLVYRR